ncbi:MAG: biopolymer transporter ExbD [Parachlamydiaceae bacterium]|nr:biopolymer transporter ExbD [Parachlamydiaceae bacterium]
MKFKSRLQSSSAWIDMTPLVDVIFLLLIFFMVTSTILPLKSLLIENPTLEKDSAPLTTQLLLVMDAQHVIYLGSKKLIVDFSNLKEHLQDELIKLKTLNQHEPTIVLSVDRRVDYGLFLRLFALTQECCSKIRLVYQPETHK